MERPVNQKGGDLKAELPRSPSNTVKTFLFVLQCKVSVEANVKHNRATTNSINQQNQLRVTGATSR